MIRILPFLIITLLLAACGRARSDSTEATSTPTGSEPPADTPVPTSEMSKETTTFEGQWDGAIDIAGTQLGITVKFRAVDGSLAATIDIPQQGVIDLSLDDVSFDGEAVHFAIASAGATFDGKLDGETIQGEFTQAGARGSFDLQRSGEVAAPTATPILPYTAEEVTWALDDTTMAATLTLPEGNGPFPAVVFVAGSGPTDRDWNSPLLPGRNGSAALLADALTRSGYATLRYDKRVTGPYAQENLAALQGKISFQSHLDELVSAVDYLAAQADVDTEQIYVLANSEGTLHALNYQTADPAVPFAGMILTGAPGRPMSEVLHQQIEQMLNAEPNHEELLANWDKAVAAFLAGKSTELDPAMPDNISQIWAGLTAPVNQPFSAELLAAQPAGMLAKIDVPVLVMIGQKDIQVDWQADGGVLEAAAGDNVTFSYPPDANHVLKHEEKPAAELSAADAASYNSADRVLDEQALRIILDWLAARG